MQTGIEGQCKRVFRGDNGGPEGFRWGGARTMGIRLSTTGATSPISGEMRVSRAAIG